jgi:hypothetical protein
MNAIANKPVAEAITQLNADLTDLAQEVSKMGLPNFDYSNPLHTFSTNNLTYTANRDCYLVGTITTGDVIHAISINGTAFNVGQYSTCMYTLKLNIGDTVVVGYAEANLHILKTLD